MLDEEGNKTYKVNPELLKLVEGANPQPILN
jgi:hypothetical protein